MNDLKIFESQEFGNVRTVLIEDNPYFVGKDVAEILGYKDTSDAIKKHVDEEDKLTRQFADSGQNRNMYIVNESGLYSLVLSSKLPSAKKFKRWVTDEVLPSIRKHGAYLTPQKIEEVLLSPDTLIQLATNLKHEQEKNKALHSQIEQDKPLTVFANAVSVSEDAILIGELAKLLKQNGINLGQNRLFEWLRENEYLIKRRGTDWNMPTQKSMEMGLFKIKETVISHADGHTSISKTVKVTGKGQIYFINLFMGNRAKLLEVLA